MKWLTIPSRRLHVPARSDRSLLLRLPVLLVRLPRRVTLLWVVLRIGVDRRRELNLGAPSLGSSQISMVPIGAVARSAT